MRRKPSRTPMGTDSRQVRPVLLDMRNYKTLRISGRRLQESALRNALFAEKNPVLCIHGNGLADVNVVGGSDAQKLLDSLSQKTLVEIAIKAKCGHVCHAAKDRVSDPVLLAQIVEASDNDFIVKELKKVRKGN